MSSPTNNEASGSMQAPNEKLLELLQDVVTRRRAGEFPYAAPELAQQVLNAIEIDSRFLESVLEIAIPSGLNADFEPYDYLATFHTQSTKDRIRRIEDNEPPTLVFKR